MDLFYASFIRRVPELLNKYRAHIAARTAKLRELVGRDVLSLIGEPPKPSSEGCVAGVDGGIDFIRIEGGHSIVVARAVAVTNTGSVILEEPIIDIVSVSSDAIGIAYLSMAESLAALKAVEQGCRYVLIDGSYYARIIALTHNMLLARHFDALFYLPELAAALISLIRVVASGAASGSEIIFVSKDSRFTVLKEHVLLGAAARTAPMEYAGVIRRLMGVYSVLWIREFRHALYDAYRSDPTSDFGTLIRLVLDRGVTDPIMLEGTVRRSRFVTKPILIGAADAYLNKKRLLTADAIFAESKKRFVDVVELDRQIDEAVLSEVFEELRWALSNAPKVWLSYVKLAEDDSPIMVEVPALSRGFMFDGTPVKAVDYTADIDHVYSLLAYHYHDPEIYNTLLWRAHSYASVSGSDSAEYAEYVKSRLGIRTARRVGIGLGI